MYTPTRDRGRAWLIAATVAVLFATRLAFRAMTTRETPPPSGTDAPGTFDLSIEVDGLTRTYRVVVPPSYDRVRPVPLVLIFHGRLGTGKIMERMTGFSGLADRHGFIAVYPDGVDRTWNAGHGTGSAERREVDDVAFVSRLIDELETQFRIDRRRVFATGISNGGVFVHRLACALSGKVAAVAAVAGPLATQVAKDCRPRRPVPVLLIHGTADRLIPWEGGETKGKGRVESVEETARFWAAIDGCPPTPEVEAVGDDVTRTSYLSPDPRRPQVVLYRVEAGGHTWPGGVELVARRLVGETNRTLDASEVIWSFFAEHPMADGPAP
jgi:polyhydroxybutyrate depolymerase